MAVNRLKNPKMFWDKIDAMPRPRRKPPPAASAERSRRELPDPDLEVRFVHRISGFGSLGRGGGWPSPTGTGARWRGRRRRSRPPRAPGPKPRAAQGAHLLSHDAGETVRYPDPFLRVKRRWIIRRLAPDCSRVELAALPRTRDELALLQAMGAETASVHLGSARAKILRSDLRSRPDRLAHGRRSRNGRRSPSRLEGLALPLEEGKG